MTRIANGNGTVRYAEVNEDYQLLVDAAIEDIERFNNRKKGKAWALYSSSTAAGTGDYVFYFKNTGTETYIINDFSVIAGAATVAYLDRVAGTAAHTSAADITPTSKNSVTSNLISATIKQDTDVTGLTNTGVVVTQACPVAATQYYNSIKSGLIITPGQAVAIRTSAATSIEMVLNITVV